MKIVFATERLKNECNNQELLVNLYGAERARLLRQRLDELFNAEVLEDMRSLPHVAIAGAPPESDLAVDLGARFSLVFRPADGSDPGGDWRNVDSILILGIRKHHAKTQS
jgi:hypothetical protein